MKYVPECKLIKFVLRFSLLRSHTPYQSSVSTAGKWRQNADVAAFRFGVFHGIWITPSDMNKCCSNILVFGWEKELLVWWWHKAKEQESSLPHWNDGTFFGTSKITISVQLCAVDRQFEFIN